MITEMAHAGGTDAGELTLAAIGRVLLILSTATVAGGALVRPLAGPPSTVARWIGWAAAGVAALTCLTTTGDGVPMPVVAAQVAVTLVVAALPATENLSRFSVAGGAVLAVLVAVEAVIDSTGAVAWVGFVHVTALAVWLGAAVALWTAGDRAVTAPRTGVISYAAAAVVLVSAVVLAALQGLAFDERLWLTPYGLVTVIETIAVIAGVAIQARRVPLATFQAAGVAVALAAWSSLAAFPPPDPLPTPGTPLLRQLNLAGARTPVLVTPSRPGLNLVHIGGANANDVSVAVDGGAPVRAGAQPGAAGGWAVVTLPPGRSTLTISHENSSASVRADTGAAGRTVAGAIGPDAAECASAALGSVVAGRNTPLTSCPSDRLSAADDASLRSLLTFLAARKVPAITVLSDLSPRSQAAAALVRTTAAALHLPVSAEKKGNRPGALVVVSGWTPAAEKLKVTGTAYTAGVWLAPWLLSAPVLSNNAGSILPLRFNPHETGPGQYAAAVARGFGSDYPTASGYLGWLGKPLAAPTQLYAASPVGFLPAEFEMHHEGAALGWLPDGTVVPITGSLPDPATS
ncbi:hypothetical protein [Fodinicola acaciae]|uniref:hypothetical protein n=1 Tax=Fodinicola acaciae TaxID=2681555 RepID=UPI0013D8A04F|nr:hypothetical protein [Fodinicola acaciae]